MLYFFAKNVEISILFIQNIKKDFGINSKVYNSLKMAEWVGFEPTHGYPSNDLANRPLQPLEYHSMNNIKLAGAEGLEPSTNGFGDHYSTN